MPVTLRPRPDLKTEHRPSRSQGNHFRTKHVLYNAYSKHYGMIKNVLASTYLDIEEDDENRPYARQGCHNGLVNAALTAYLQHHHLILRPEDIWFAILSQFSIFINANAERVRSLFVQHEGQKELEVEIDPQQYGVGAKKLAAIIQDNVKMEGLKEWIIPGFTTTTETDREIASVMMMGAMQKYFTYKISITCGLPLITLLGEKADYEDMLRRLAFLKGMALGEEVERWHAHLEPVLQGFVRSFDGEKEESLGFWNNMIDYHSSCMSGHSSTISGWLTAFCFWDDDEKLMHSCTMEQALAGCKDEVALDKFPSGVVSVPVKIEFKIPPYTTLDCRMYAGLGAYEITKSDQAVDGEDKEDAVEKLENVPNAIQPLSGWWLCEFDDTEMVEKGYIRKAP